MLAWVAQLLATYGYWAVALVVMGESLGLPLPGETLLLLGGASAGAGYLEIWGVIVAAAGGAMVGDTLGYELGRWGGRPFLERYGHLVHLKPHHLARAEAFVARYGTKAVFFGRFIAILRTYSAFLAGVSRLPYPRFLLCNAAGGILWVLTFGWLGATFGSQWPLIQRWTGRAGLLMLGLLGLVGVVVLLGRWAIRHEAELRARGAARMRRDVTRPVSCHPCGPTGDDCKLRINHVGSGAINVGRTPSVESMMVGQGRSIIASRAFN